MSNTLIGTVVQYGSQLIESYKRKTKASPEELTKQGLNSNQEYQSVIGIASIKEYVIFQTTNIVKNQTKTFKTNRWGADLAFKSLYIDSPEADELYIEIYDDSRTLIITQPLEKRRTPFEFPINPLQGNLTIKIRALQDIAFVRLVAVPCKILETIYAEEDYPKN